MNGKEPYYMKQSIFYTYKRKGNTAFRNRSVTWLSRVKIEIQKHTGAELLFPALRKSTKGEIRYMQLERAFEDALVEDK